MKRKGLVLDHGFKGSTPRSGGSLLLGLRWGSWMAMVENKGRENSSPPGQEAKERKEETEVPQSP